MQPTELPLKDIHLPEAISWFPPAIGWWLLIILMPLLIYLSITLYQRLTRKTALKTAKQLLTQLINSPLDNNQKLSELSVLLRRVAISIMPAQQVASLTGDAWLAFLDSALKDAPFSTGAGRCLLDAPYRKLPPSDAELSALIQLCFQWLNAQKPS
jgi:hypothetical protein